MGDLQKKHHLDLRFRFKINCNLSSSSWKKIPIQAENEKSMMLILNYDFIKESDLYPASDITRGLCYSEFWRTYLFRFLFG